MKKLKILTCGSLLLCSGLMFAGCGEDLQNFEAGNINIGAQTVVYNGEEQLFSVTGYEGATVTYSKDNKQTFVSAADLDLVNAGTYTIYFKLTKNGYEDFISGAKTFVIEQKPITVTIPTIQDFINNAKTKEQVVNQISLIYQTGSVIDGDTLNVNYSVEGYNHSSPEVKSYAINGVDNDGNYAITFNAGAYKLTAGASVTNGTETTYYQTFAQAFEEAVDGSTIKLYNNCEVSSQLKIRNSITIDGQGLYSISAAENFSNAHLGQNEIKSMLAVVEDKDVTFKNVTINANNKERAVHASAGKVVIDGATVTGGLTSSYAGGVYITGAAEIQMTSGTISGNQNAEQYRDDGYVQYCADLWIGSQASGVLNSVSGGTIGSVFVNANSYLTDTAGFKLDGGTIENLYVEYDDNKAATFEYTSGTLNNLYVSTLQIGEAAKVTPRVGTTYKAGVAAMVTVDEVDTIFHFEDIAPGGEIYEFLAENPTAYVKTYIDAEYIPMVLSVPQVNEIVLIRDVTLNSTLTISRSVVINGQNKFTIRAGEAFTDGKLIALQTEGATLTLKDVTLDANYKARVVYVNAGTLKIDGAKITKGKANNADETNNFIGGVYVTHGAKFVMTSGEITGNSVGSLYEDDNYLEYSADLWIGANAKGELNSEISGGIIGNVFVNANSFSATNKGDFIMNGGTVTNVYVEYADGYGAKFEFNGGVLENLYVSTGVTGEAEKVENPIAGTIYNGGEIA